MLTTGMEILTPEEILMFLRSHHPQTGPPRSSRKPCLDCLQGTMGEDKSILLPSTSTHFKVILVRPWIMFGSLLVWDPWEKKAVMKDDLKCFISARIYLLDHVQCERTNSDKLTGEGYRNSAGS